MSKISYIKQLIEKNNQSIARRTAAGLLSLGVLAGSLSACDNLGTTQTNTSDSTNTTDTTITTENNIINSNLPPVGTYKVTHSDTYNNTKQIWNDVWNESSVSLKREEGFQLKGLPVTFLLEQGVLAYNEDGNLYAYGNEDFTNNDCIQVKAFIDESTKENELYLLVQYVSGPVSSKTSDNDAYVATWMLKYELDTACYKDLLLLEGDFRRNLLIQQIDKDYEPQIISKSIIDYDLIGFINIFRNLPHNASDEKIIIDASLTEFPLNYVESIDYDNMSLTINFGTRYGYEYDKIYIYSYTYNLKDSPQWTEMLTGNQWASGLSQAYRDSLTNEQIMTQYDTILGKALNDCSVQNWVLRPSDEHKNSATIKYDCTAIGLDGPAAGMREVIEKYENGQIKYSQVNSLTRAYSQTEEYNQ